MNSPSNFPLLRIAGVCALLAGSAFGQGNDSLSHGQEYYYGGGRYQGLSSDVLINGALDAPAAGVGAISGASAFLTQITTFGAWQGMQTPEGYVGLSGAMGLALPNLFTNQTSISHIQKQDPYFGYRLGPFYVDQVYGGIATIYSDVQGNPPGITQAGLDDDNWSAMTWLSARFTAYVTDRFAITINPWIYWLPLKNEVGWAAGGGLFGLNSYLNPQTSATIGFHIPVGRWDFSFYDQFQAFMLQDSILSENFFVNAQAWDMSPVDPAGRFQFGGFGPSYVDMTGDTRLSTNDQLFRSDRLFFRNNAYFNATTTIGTGMSFSTYYGRYDFWDDDMDHLGAWDTAGAVLAGTKGNFRPYVAYQGTTYDGWSSSYHWLLTGAAARVNPQLLLYGNVGYLWSSSADQSRDQDSWLGTFGARHQIGPWTSHSLEGGRSVTDPEFNQRTRSDYVSYMLTHILGPRLSTSVFLMYADRQYLNENRVGRDHKIAAAGAVARIILDDKSTLSLFTAFERLRMEDIDRGWDVWTYRANYFRRIGMSTSFHMMYQYQDAGAGSQKADNFSEHLIYAGVMKQF